MEWRKIPKLLWSKKWTLLIVAIVGGVAALPFTVTQPAKYVSKAKVLAPSWGWPSRTALRHGLWCSSGRRRRWLRTRT